MEDTWGEARWTAPDICAVEYVEDRSAFLPVLYTPPFKPRIIPIWRIVASTILIQVLACTTAILFYLTFFAHVAG